VKRGNNIKPPLLSVCLITYNQSKYITRALEGILMQESDFQWDIIIADDCSTDGTREIIIDYKTRYPDRIKLIIQSQNVGAARNWLELIQAPTGKYTAYLEGDDYWTQKNKLQKQVEFLERNPDYAMCFHKVKIETRDGLVEDFITKIPPNRDSFTTHDLARTNFIHSPTIVFRNKLIEIPDWILDSPIGDYPLYLLLSLKGKIKLINECMAVYRINSGSWSQHDDVYRLIKTLNMLSLVKCDMPRHIIKELAYNIESECLNSIQIEWSRVNAGLTRKLSIKEKLKAWLLFKRNAPKR